MGLLDVNKFSGIDLDEGEGNRPLTLQERVQGKPEPMSVPLQDEAGTEGAAPDVQRREIEAATESLPSTRAAINNNYQLRDNLDQLGAMERISRAFERGALQNEAGRSRFEDIDEGRASFRTKQLEAQIEALGNEEHSGFTGFLTGTSEVLGGLADQVFSSSAIQSAGVGAAGGAVVAGPVGAIGGGVVGLTVDLMRDTFTSMSGDSYVQLIEEGVEPDTAKTSAFVVGAIGSSLELVGATGVGAPMAKAGKEALKKAVPGAIKRPEVKSLIGEFSKAWATGVAAEVATETAQEVVQVAAEEIGKDLAAADLPSISQAELSDRLAEVMVKTFKSTALLAGASSGVGVAAQRKQVQQENKAMQEMAKEAQAMAETQPPEVVTARVEELLNERDHYISPEGIAALPAEVVKEMGVDTDAMSSTDQDVKVSAAKMAELMVLPEFKELEEHMRSDRHDLTPAEMAELNDIDTVEDDPAIEQIGMRELFKTADEAGMTPAQWSSYQADRKTTLLEAEKAVAKQALLREERALAKPIKKRRTSLLELETEALRQEPVYAAQEAKGEADIIADLYGFKDAEDMKRQIKDAPTLKQKATANVEEKLRQEFPVELEEIDNIRERKEALAAVDVGKQARSEMNSLRALAGERLISSRLVKSTASFNLGELRVNDVKPLSMMNKSRVLGNKAGKAVKAGDWKLAADLKFKQAVNLEMVKQSFAHSRKVEADRKFLSKLKKPKVVHDQDVQNVINKKLEAVNLKTSPNKKKGELGLKEALAALENRPGEAHVFDADSPMPWKLMSMRNWDRLVSDMKKLNHIQKQEGKRRKDRTQAETTNSVLEIVDGLSQLKSVDTNKIKGRLGRAAGWATEGVSSLFMNVDAVASVLDKGNLNGPVFRNIVKPIDDAVNKGYREGQVGLHAREEQVRRDMNRLIDKHFTKSQRGRLHKRRDVPGLSRGVTNEEFLSALLNMGNEGNKEAMVKSGTFTDTDLQDIQDAATHEDLQFAQDVWDMIGSFWQEISDTEFRRTGARPKKVEAQSITKDGQTYGGGYYPLTYENVGGTYQDSIQELAKSARTGQLMRTQTSDGHTKSRTSARKGNPVKLDLFVMKNHLSNVAYDLEMGDAVNDVGLVLRNPLFREAMKQKGMDAALRNLELWETDAATGYMASQDSVSSAMRYVRQATVISALGLNLSVIAQQPTGLIQSAVIAGKRNVAYATTKFAVNPVGAFRTARRESAFMRNRHSNWLADLDRDDHPLNKALVEYIPGAGRRTSQFVRRAAFIGIQKAQAMVDVITWNAALSQAGKQGMTRAQAVAHADRVVKKTQGTGNMTDRSAFGRGTTGARSHQNELTKSMALFMSYFEAKMSVVAHSKAKRNLRNPVQLLGFAGDLGMLFVLEGILAGAAAAGVKSMFYGDDKSAEELEDDFLMWAGKQSLGTAFAMVPIARDVSNFLISGFSPRGQTAPVAQAAGKIASGELGDVISGVGLFAKIPTNHPVKIIEALNE